MRNLWPDPASGRRPSCELNQSGTPEPLLFPPEPRASFSFSFACSFSSPLSVAKAWTGSLHLFLVLACLLMLFSLPRGRKQATVEGMEGKWAIPVGCVRLVDHLDGPDGPVTCLAGSLYLAAQAFGSRHRRPR